MAEIKAIIIALNYLGYAGWVWSFIESWGDVKSVILFILAIVFAIYKILSGHIDYMKKKIEFDESRREKREKRKSEKANKKLNDADKDKGIF